MTDVIDHLYEKALQTEAAAQLMRWSAQYANLAEVGISALPSDLLGDQWRDSGWKATTGALIRLVGKLSQEVAELKKGRQ